MFACLATEYDRKEGTGRTCLSASPGCTKEEYITFCQLCRSDPSNLLTPLIFEMPKRTSGFIIVAMINLVHVLIALVAQCQANATAKHAFLSPVLYQQNIRTKKNRSLVGYLQIYVFL